MAQNELFCIGNAMVDVFAAVNSAYPRQHGITQSVQHIDADAAQRLMDDLRGGAGAVGGHGGGGGPVSGPGGKGGPLFASGGGAANVAKIAAMLGMGAAFAGAVGTGTDSGTGADSGAGTNSGGAGNEGSGDELAAVFEADLRKADVSLFLKKAAGKTGTCFVLNSGGTETIAASPGAALEFGEADVREEWIAGAEAVVLDGYLLDRRPLVQRILHLAHKNGIPVALDAASVFHIREKTEEILHYSRNYPLIVFMNADESIAFYNTIKKTSVEEEIAGEREKETLILREICPVLKYMTEGEIFPIIVIKLGGRGVVVLAGGNVYREETFAIIPRNTVGAGDAFCAAFVSAWIRGKSISECAALGNRIAREVLSVPGTQIKSAKLKSFAKLLREKPPKKR